MNGMLRNVKEFSEVFGKLVNPKPTMVEKSDFDFIYEFIKEELEEYKEAFEEGDIIGVADAFADIQYVLNAGILAHGLQDAFAELFTEVQGSNMSKSCKSLEEALETIEVRQKEHGPCHYEQQGDLYIVYRSRDRKVMKSIRYFKPNLTPIIEKYSK